MTSNHSLLTHQNEHAATVFVEMNATHLCEAMRGIETKSTTTTRAIIGEPTAIDREQFRSAVASAGDNE